MSLRKQPAPSHLAGHGSKGLDSNEPVAEGQQVTGAPAAAPELLHMHDAQKKGHHAPDAAPVDRDGDAAGVNPAHGAEFSAHQAPLRNGTSSAVAVEDPAGLQDGYIRHLRWQAQAEAGQDHLLDQAVLEWQELCGTVHRAVCM